jgi:hypothetical protein
MGKETVVVSCYSSLTLVVYDEHPHCVCVICHVILVCITTDGEGKLID